MKCNKIQTIQYNSLQVSNSYTFRHRRMELRCQNMQDFDTLHELCLMFCILLYFNGCICWFIIRNFNAYLLCDTYNIRKYEKPICINIKGQYEHSHVYSNFWLCLYLLGLESTHLTSVSTSL